MEVICLEDRAFFALLEKVITHIREKHEVKEDRWISGEEAMQKLRITSKSTLAKYKNQGVIRFSQPARKVVLYDVQSINHFLEKNAKETF